MTSHETANKQGSAHDPFSAPLTTPFKMANWLVTPDLNAIQHLQSKQTRSLEPRLMQLLCTLAANSLRVLSREYLVSQLWPNVIVNENSLTRAISELRKQLRDGCEKETIETIPKRGYRLKCPAIAVESIKRREFDLTPNSKDQIPPSLLSQVPGLGVSALQLPRLSLLALGFSAFLAATISNDTGTSTMTTAADTDTTVLSDELMMTTPDYFGGEIALSSAQASDLMPASITKPIVSHDGERFAYVAYNQSGSTIFIGNLSQSDAPYPIYHDSGNLVNLAWSPVGDSLLFAKKPSLRTANLFDSEADSELLVLDVLTGRLQKLVEEKLPRNKQAISESSLT